MATSDGSAVFIDTNVLVYAVAAAAPLHAAALRALQHLYDGHVELWISRQVVREYLAMLTRPQLFSEPVPLATLADDIRHFESRFRIAEDGPSVTQRLLALMGQVRVGGRQVHDANVVATMQVYGIRRLLTHNVTDFARFARVITVMPLEAGA